ncbi:hypothetical protein PP175_29565 (plasmid) [Aneurinibacillus sp. Ricciae_BoGa-3]|uniref:hypothetical protein n=1 Tax=Aneurinibacillus sp. Ricciae_BoGa-3 TaxID=3022697 RepID=UPI00234010A1|nr:hypothetical protein [Aneurinibacillus sp. Ricciae_BoGa-3]WCK57341.1 hypothetical protein PP175_29565 [Aneurinibacillus sp. Ricciae_BoGa-3]
MFVTTGQYKDITKVFQSVNRDDCSVIAEGGSDNGKTFSGSFLVKIKRKGVYRFEDGNLLKKVR